MSLSRATRRLHGWLQLLRLPNLLTVPGDPVVGFLLARHLGVERSLLYMAVAGAVSLLVYCAGLISNDCFDLREDTADRPDRPLPSGAISFRTAVIAAWGCGLAGLGLAVMAGPGTVCVGAVLIVLVLAYNAWTKHIPCVGDVNMGACRGMSVLLGAAAAGWRPVGVDIVVVAAAGWALYVACVTALAARETQRVRVAVRRWLPAIASVGVMAGLWWQGGARHPLFVILSVVAVAWPCGVAIRVGAHPEPRQVGNAIGGLLCGLLLLQAAGTSVVLPIGGVAAGLLLLAVPLNRWLAKRFYAS